MCTGQCEGVVYAQGSQLQVAVAIHEYAIIGLELYLRVLVGTRTGRMIALWHIIKQSALAQ